jgi:hypothetical protein
MDSLMICFTCAFSLTLPSGVDSSAADLDDSSRISALRILGM